MPAVIAIIIGAIFKFIIAKIIATLVIGAITYVGIMQLIDFGIQQLNYGLSGLPSDVLSWANMMGIFEGASIIISAHIALIQFNIANKIFNKLSFGV